MKTRIVLLAALLALPAIAVGNEIEKSADKFLRAVPQNTMFLMPVKNVVSALEAKDANLVVLDVRSPAQYSNGHIKGALNIPLTMVVKEMKRIPAGKEIAVVCSLDTNSAFAVATLRMLGYNAWIVDGGVPGWVRMGLPLEK